ncbi:FkbM family methyltransferase [Luminiphilus sp.]|nr:FkbM family methyltransferase [Luminiphilus sp.]
MIKRWLDWSSSLDEVAICRELLADERLTYLDIGAAGGLLPRLRPFKDLLFCVTFEPQDIALPNDDVAPFSSSQGGRQYPYAVSNTIGKESLKLTKGRNESSLVQPNRAFSDGFRASDRFDVEQLLEVPTITLDSLDLPVVDVVKIDVQGALSKVLDGGKGLLTRALMVEAELEFHEVYENQFQIGDVICELRKLGLELEDFTDLIRWQRINNEFNTSSVGSLVHGDALFISGTGEELLRMSDEGKLRRLLAGLVVYRRFEMLLYLSNAPALSGPLAARIKMFAERKIRKHRMVAEVINKVARLMGPGSSGHLIP